MISTSLLTGYRGKYKLVSPILLEEDIQELKEEFRLLSQKKRLSHAIPTPVSTREDTYEDVLAFIEEINRLLELFTLQTIDNGPNLEETLSEVMKHFSKALVQDRKKVANKLVKRYLQAPVGIPKTHFALFHASSTEILQPVFKIFDLSQGLSLYAMDKQEINVTRLLVMLAPYPIDEQSSKILGRISGSIIMNDLNTEIFNSGNFSIIYQLLATLLIEEIKQ